MKTLRLLALLLATAACLAWPARAQQALKVNDPRVVNAVRNYTQEATAAIDPLLVGLTPGASTQNRLSVNNRTTHTYALNPSAFYAPYAASLSCVSVDSTTTDFPTGYRATLIAPGYAVTALHTTSLATGEPAPPAGTETKPGTTFYWLGTDGNTYPGVVSTLTAITGDLALIKLTANINPAVSPAQVMPAVLPAGFTFVGLPVFYLDQNQEGFIADSSAIFTGSPAADSIVLPTESNRTPWEKAGGPGVLGESTSPYGFVLGGKFVLLGCFHSNNGNGPDIGANATATQAAMAGQTLTVANLPGYPVVTSTTPTGSGNFDAGIDGAYQVSAIPAPSEGQVVTFADSDDLIYAYQYYTSPGTGSITANGTTILTSTVTGGFWFLLDTYDLTGLTYGSAGDVHFPADIAANNLTVQSALSGSSLSVQTATSNSYNGNTIPIGTGNVPISAGALSITGTPTSG